MIFDRHEFEQASGVGDGQGSLVCCSPWGRKESDMTEQLNWTDGIGIKTDKLTNSTEQKSPLHIQVTDFLQKQCREG